MAEAKIPVYGTRDQWEHLIYVYETLALEHPDDMMDWYGAAEWIRNSINGKTR